MGPNAYILTHDLLPGIARQLTLLMIHSCYDVTTKLEVGIIHK
jgi:hypothetical protein